MIFYVYVYNYIHLFILARLNTFLPKDSGKVFAATISASVSPNPLTAVSIKKSGNLERAARYKNFGKLYFVSRISDGNAPQIRKLSVAVSGFIAQDWRNSFKEARKLIKVAQGSWSKCDGGVMKSDNPSPKITRLEISEGGCGSTCIGYANLKHYVCLLVSKYITIVVVWAEAAIFPCITWGSWICVYAHADRLVIRWEGGGAIFCTRRQAGAIPKLINVLSRDNSICPAPSASLFASWRRSWYACFFPSLAQTHFVGEMHVGARAFLWHVHAEKSSRCMLRANDLTRENVLPAWRIWRDTLIPTLRRWTLRRKAGSFLPGIRCSS